MAGGLFGTGGQGSPGSGGLLDLFGGSATDPGALYNGLLTSDHNKALAYRGLLAAAGAFGQAAMPSRMPIPIGAAFGQAAAAMGNAQDTSALNAMRGSLLGLQGKELNAKIGLLNAANEPPPPMNLPNGGAAGNGSGGGEVGSPAPNAVSDGGIGAGQLYGFLTQNGATPNEAAMLTSAANSESSFRPDITHDGGIGYGLFGHNTDRLAAMRQFAGVGPNDPVSWQKQALFALNELHGSEGKAGAMVNAATTPEQLTDAQLAFERPNLNIAGGNRAQRLAATREYMANPPGAKPTQLAQANTSTATDALPDNPYAGTQGQGIYVPPGGTQARDIATNQPVTPGGGLLPAPAAPSMLAPQAPGSDTLRMGGALSPSALAVPQGLLPAPPTMEEHAAGLLGFPSHPAASPPTPQPTVTPFTNAPPVNGVGAPAPGPQGGLLPAQAPQVAQTTSSPAPVPSGAAGMGGINPAYIQWAQRQARVYAALGMTPPADIAAAAGLPLVGPKAGLEAAAQYPYKIGEAVAPQIERGNQTRQTQAQAFAYTPHFENGVMTQPIGLPGFVAPPSLGARSVPGLGGGAPSGTPTPAPTPTLSPNSSPGQVPGVMNEAQKMILQNGLAETEKRLNEPGGYHAEGKAAQEQVANAAAITDLLPRVRMGWNANTVQDGARILSGLGVDNDSIKRFLGTDPAAGDELNKLFLQFSAGAVRQMGAREPGSVISLFAKAFPNLETMPNAALLMTNALRMQAQWKMDRANAADSWALNQQRNAGPTGENYQGMKGFEASFGKSNDPRDYWRAAAAMSNEPDIAWRGLDDAGKQRIFDLIPPGAQFRAGDGKLYPKPGAQ